MRHILLGSLLIVPNLGAVGANGGLPPAPAQAVDPARLSGPALIQVPARAPARTPPPPAAAESMGPAEIGRAHPALELDTIDGRVLNGTGVAGEILVVEFFATWCAPCDRALADLLAAIETATEAAIQAGRPVSVRVALVSLGEPEEVVRRWAASRDLPGRFTVALDPAGIAARRWGARRLPTTFIVDRTGTVRHINRGWGTGYRARLSRWLGDVTAVP